MGTGNYLVVGAGAVGLGVASFLHRAGGRVAVLARGDTAAALRRSGLCRDGVLGDHTARPDGLTVVEALTELPQQPFDYVLVCVKSFDSETIATSLAACPELLGGRGRVVLCQNGWGNAEVFARFLPARRILNALFFTGFERLASNRVRVTGHARPVRVGGLFDRSTTKAGTVCTALTASGLSAEPTDHVARDLWDKMLLNCAVNPLGALFGLPPRRLFASPRVRSFAAGLIGETFAVLRASGYDAHAAGASAYLDTFYRELIPAMADHTPSMLQDLRGGRRTEIDALNGAVVRLGERAGVAVPCNRAVWSLIRHAERRGLRGKAGPGEPTRPPVPCRFEIRTPTPLFGRCLSESAPGGVRTAPPGPYLS
jgi:2-dehydropantoate 2-reductase